MRKCSLLGLAVLTMSVVGAQQASAQQDVPFEDLSKLRVGMVGHFPVGEPDQTVITDPDSFEGGYEFEVVSNDGAGELIVVPVSYRVAERNLPTTGGGSGGGSGTANRGNPRLLRGKPILLRVITAAPSGARYLVSPLDVFQITGTVQFRDRTRPRSRPYSILVFEPIN